jgi:hypothetical protein
MNPGHNFRLPKAVKRQAANYLDPHRRGQYLRAMIQATTASQEQPRRSRGSKSEKT